MQTFTLKAGLSIVRDGRVYRFHNRLMDRRLQLKDEFGEPLLMTESMFYQEYADRKIVVNSEQPHLGKVPMTINAPPDLSCFLKAHSEEAIRRRTYLQRLVDVDTGALPSNAELPSEISKVAAAICDRKRPPSFQTVRRWWKVYSTSRCVVRLVPRHQRKGRATVFREEVESILQDVLNETFLKEEPTPISLVYKLLSTRIIEFNKQRLPGQLLHIPCEMTLRRYIQRLDPREVDAAQLGKFAARRKHRDAIGNLSVDQILDRWEIDHTLLDVLLVDPETGEVIGRPYLTVVLDRRSRMVMAYLIHLSAPGTESVLRVIERAIKPKDSWLKKFPKVANLWAARGLPLVIVPDNAAEFHADDLVQAFNELGIEILYPRSRGPEMKGAVERFFRTLNMGLIHSLPGTTFSNTAEKGDYPAEQRACLTLPELERMILKWIVDIYHQRPHRGLGNQTPAQVWNHGEQYRSPCLPADLDSLEAILAGRKKVRVHHYGIETDGQIYHSAELAELRHRLPDGEMVDIRIRDELGHIWVRDPFRKVFIRVPAKDKEIHGLSRDIYRQSRKIVRANKGDVNDGVSVAKTYQDIMAEADAAKSSNKLRKRRFSAQSKLNKEGDVRTEIAKPVVLPVERTTSKSHKLIVDQPGLTIRPRSDQA